MFKDTDQELRRLEEALLEEAPVDEQTDEELLEEETLDQLLADTGPAEGRVVYQNFSNDYGTQLRNYANGYKAYNTDTCDQDLESYSEAVREDQRRSNGGLVLLACLLTAGIIAVIIWWLVRYGGLL